MAHAISGGRTESESVARISVQTPSSDATSHFEQNIVLISYPDWLQISLAHHLDEPLSFVNSANNCILTINIALVFTQTPNLPSAYCLAGYFMAL